MADQDELGVRFLTQGEQTGEQVAGWIEDFVARASSSLDLALYDLRLSPPLREIIEGALRERTAAGVSIRVAYDAGKPEQPTPVTAVDPAPPGTGPSVQALGFPSRAIGGPKLMHQKYIVRDAGTAAGAVWTGSLNWTDDAFTLEENNVVLLQSPELAATYELDFAQLWSKGIIDHSGNFPTPPVTLRYAGAPADVRVYFSPGKGEDIDHIVTRMLDGARRRILICSMLLNSGAMLNALLRVLAAGRVAVRGVYDRTQMEGVFQDWSDDRRAGWKIDAVRQVVAGANLIGKRSTPYTPDGPHDFMHNKILVIDDTVITGSYNLSHSATLNAENILLIDSPALAAGYADYIRRLMDKYGAPGGELGAPR